MAEQAQAGKGQALNDRTYQEVEYLKKNLGPILVAALAEICIRRPGDPIEYLGHWLLRWRYNEELKRKDVQNALEVVRQKAWSKDDGNQAQAPQIAQAFTPAAAPGEEPAAEARKSEPTPPADSGERRASGEEKRLSGQQGADGGEARRASGAEERRASGGEERRASGGEERRASGGEERRASGGEERRASGGDPATGGEPEPSAEAAEERRPSGEAPPADEPPAAEAMDEPPPAPEEITAE